MEKCISWRRFFFCYITNAATGQYVGTVDYIVLTYTFSDGRDLDTRTKITSPNIGGTYVGWGQTGDQNGLGIVVWGGDNTGTGVESVLIDVKKLRTDYSTEPTLTIDCNCMWYGTVGLNPVVLSLTLYRGGTMVQNGYTWTNNTATNTANLYSAGFTVTVFSQSASNIGQNIGTLTYDMNSGVFTL